MNAYIFPGQGSQFVGMGKELYESSSVAKEMFEKANKILGFRITDLMFNGTNEDLRQTKVTQPAIFLHSVILKKVLESNFKLDMVAGHSLGEFSALVSNGSLSFEDGLKLVYKRAMAMQKSCEKEISTMAAVIGMEDKKVEEICNSIDEIVVPANYNTKGQIVISGSEKGIDLAIKKLKASGGRKAINETCFKFPICPIYQNVNAKAVKDPEIIKGNLIAQLTSPVKWTQTIQNMIKDGASNFTEVGPGKILQSLIKKINRKIPTRSA
ncbi:MAG: malonyl CoA-acyl carrier protein transacylase [Bacteroidetes bacterium 4572_128]|nr:MAG: malonyl CoA-acyl carrier protein transacylase [Bacteroidetes bacterium 4572_128]